MDRLKPELCRKPFTVNMDVGRLRCFMAVEVKPVSPYPQCRRHYILYYSTAWKKHIITQSRGHRLAAPGLELGIKPEFARFVHMDILSHTWMILHPVGQGLMDCQLNNYKKDHWRV